MLVELQQKDAAGDFYIQFDIESANIISITRNTSADDPVTTSLVFATINGVSPSVKGNDDFNASLTMLTNGPLNLKAKSLNYFVNDNVGMIVEGTQTIESQKNITDAVKITASGGANATTLIECNGTTDEAINIKANSGGIKKLTVGDTVNIVGNLAITGTTTTISSSNTVISDRIIELNSGMTGDNTNDSGIIIERGTGTLFKCFYGWDESDDRFIFGTTDSTGSSASLSNFVLGKIAAQNLEIQSIDSLTNILNLTGTGVNIQGNTADIDILTSANLDLDGAKVEIDGTDNSNMTVTGEGKSLTLSVAGGGAQKLNIQSAGTGNDAITINSSAGGIDIDASGTLNIDSATGINIGISMIILLILIQVHFLQTLQIMLT